MGSFTVSLHTPITCPEISIRNLNAVEESHSLCWFPAYLSLFSCAFSSHSPWNSFLCDWHSFFSIVSALWIWSIPFLMSFSLMCFSKFLTLACASLSRTQSQPDWKPFWGDSGNATAMEGEVPEALSCVPALGDAEPGQLLCPHLCQAQLWADPGPPLQTRLGGKGEKWRDLMTARVCFWIEVQPWSLVFAATWPSGVNGNWIQKVAWELLAWLPCLVVSSSAKLNKPNLSNILFLGASAT